MEDEVKPVAWMWTFIVSNKFGVRSVSSVPMLWDEYEKSEAIEQMEKTMDCKVLRISGVEPLYFKEVARDRN